MTAKRGQQGQQQLLLRKPRAPPPWLPPVSPDGKSQDSRSLVASEPSRTSGYGYENAGMQYTPDLSMAPSMNGFSPPPPSEMPTDAGTMSLVRQNPSSRPRMSRRQNRTDARYMIDPLHREHTNLGTYVEGGTLIKPCRQRGPEGFVVTLAPRRNPPFLDYFAFEEIDRFQPQLPEFTLQDFLRRVSNHHRMPLATIKKVMYSKHNYIKLTRLMADACSKTNPVLNTLEMKPPEELPFPETRIPQKQLLIEMAALVKEQMSGIMQMEMKPVIRPLPKYSPDYYKPGTNVPHTEILLYEDTSQDKKSNATSRQQSHHTEDTDIPGSEGMFHTSPTKYFQGSKRSNSPFAVGEDSAISPSELAILDSLFSGGKALSLKAHFICQLPDIEPLMKTITYLNLSFNDFRFIPYEVFEIEQLTVLKFRNNPLTEIPAEISRLHNLHTLVLSFCLISTLPPNLFSLTQIKHLDVSYNKISFIPNEIKNLRNLMELNVEGNQLSSMPVGALGLRRLKYLRVRNNFMHPLFWKENSVNEPQRLIDIASLSAHYAGLHQMDCFTGNITKILNSYTTCDCCHGPMYGPGIRIIRPVTKIFGIKNLPFLFRSCSQYCAKLFWTSSDNLIEMLYGADE